jgi:hypothetical protein
VDLPIKNGGSFHSYVAVYQRVLLEAQAQLAPTHWASNLRPNLDRSRRAKGCRSTSGRNRSKEGQITHDPQISPIIPYIVEIY